jgi:hypothetical protein
VCSGGTTYQEEMRGKSKRFDLQSEQKIKKDFFFFEKFSGAAKFLGHF